MKIKVILHEETDGGYWAEVPALPGCVTEGDTYEEVVSNLTEAIEGWLSVAAELHAVRREATSGSEESSRELELAV